MRRYVESGVRSGEVRGTPTVFIDGRLHDGRYGAADLLAALSA
jgi:protein-disulfide isomerase